MQTGIVVNAPRTHITPAELIEVRQCEAEYSRSVVRATKIMRRLGTDGAAVEPLLEEERIQTRAIRRIKEIYGVL